LNLVESAPTEIQLPSAESALAELRLNSTELALVEIRLKSTKLVPIEIWWYRLRPKFSRIRPSWSCWNMAEFDRLGPTEIRRIQLSFLRSKLN